MFKRRTDMDGHPKGVRSAQAAPRLSLDQARKARPFQILHQRVMRLPKAEAAHDVRMSQGRKRCALAARSPWRTKDLACHRTPGRMVPNHEDWIVAAGVNPMQDAECVADFVARAYAGKRCLGQAASSVEISCAANNCRQREFVRSNTEGLPLSTTQPFSKTTIRSARWIEESRWPTISTVR